MLRSLIGVSIAAGLIVAAADRIAQAQGPRRGEQLMPRTTAGFVAFANFGDFEQHWKKTQLGHLINDPVMEPFAKDLRRQFEDRWSGVHERLGLTLDDLTRLAGGELDVAMIHPALGQSAMAVLIDVTGHVDEARAVLARASANLTQQGAKRTQLKAGKVDMLVFALPRDERDPQDQARYTVYFLTGNLLGAADDVEVTKGILARVQGQGTQGDSLADVAGFQAVMQRCQKDDGAQATPQVRWFIHPLSYADAARASQPVDRRRKGKTVLELLQNQGFEAMQGIGGFADFSPTEGFELIHRTAVYAPPPYENAMKMLVFPNAQDFAPQPWVPRDIASYTTFYVDIMNAFDNFGPLFDDLFGDPQLLFRVKENVPQAIQAMAAGKVPKEIVDGLKKIRVTLGPKVTAKVRVTNTSWLIKDSEAAYVARLRNGILWVYLQTTGVWEDVLDGFEHDPNGPKINLRKELIAHLGQRVTALTDYQLPISTSSERILIAVESKDDKAVAAAIEKWLKSDQTAKRRVIDGQIIWEMVPEETDEPQVPVVALPPLEVPGAPGKSTKKSPGEAEDGDNSADDEAQEKERRLFPHAAVTVANGHLLIASHMDFLLKVLKGKKQEPLVDDPEYKRVDETIAKLGFPARCGRMFSLTDEQYRPTYELIRQNKLPQSETMLARLLNALFGEGKKGVPRRQKIDGEKLPDYDTVRRYLGPAGAVAASEPDGWFLKGFTLTK